MGDVPLCGADDPGVCGADVAGWAFVAARAMGVGDRGGLPGGYVVSDDSPAAWVAFVAEPGSREGFGGDGGYPGARDGSQHPRLFCVSGLCAVGFCHLSGAFFLCVCQSWPQPEVFQCSGLGGTGIRDFSGSLWFGAGVDPGCGGFMGTLGFCLSRMCQGDLHLVREVLHDSKVFNPMNASHPISYDHLLNARRFSSVIVREENIYGNRSISDYVRGNSLFQLLEADKIKEDIRNREIDMWNY